MKLLAGKNIHNIIFCFNYSLPFMMLKNKQTNCLFVNFKKEMKTKGIGIFFFNNKNKNRYKHILTDRLNGNIAVIRWTLKKYVVNTF